MGNAQINRLYNETEQAIRRLYHLDSELDKAQDPQQRLNVLESQLRCIETIETNAAVRARVIRGASEAVHNDILRQTKSFHTRIKTVPKDQAKSHEAKRMIEELGRLKSESEKLVKSAKRTASGRGLIGRIVMRN